jgi:CheY-like chemotaxis protein
MRFAVPDSADAPPDAFLSYTRLDDQFYGGSITALQRMLELGVKVVTGDRGFSIFQDVDDIGFGEQFQKRLDVAVAEAWFFLPIITPLFFSSAPCRDELQKFFAHEKGLGRDDLVLPIYYVTAPVLEKADLLAKDPLATEIQKRQRYDWRANTDLPVGDPKLRLPVMDLAKKIAEALARTKEPKPPTRQSIPRPGTLESVSPRLPGQVLFNKRAVDSAFTTGLDTIIAETDDSAPAQRKGEQQRTVLWVDDNPDNNIYERRAMEAYNVKFELAVSTGEALAKLRNTRFDAIISDMGRAGDSHAGYTLLEALRGSRDETPYFIFSSASNPQYLALAQSKGAKWSTNVSEVLIAKVLACLDEKSGSSQ